jgi:outer membrane protein TolC
MINRFFLKAIFNTTAALSVMLLAICSVFFTVRAQVPGRPDARAAQPGTTELTPQEFYRQILQQHPVVRQAALFRQSADQELRIARGFFDPKVEAGYDAKVLGDKEYYRHWDNVLKIPTWIGEFKAGYERHTGQFVNPELRTEPEGLGYAGFSLPLGQGLLIDSRRATLRQARIMQDIAEADQLKEVNKLLFEAAKDYWYWWQAYHELVQVEEAYELARIRFQAVKIRVTEGDLAPIDSVDALTLYQERSIQLQQALVGLDNARLILSNYMWGENDTPLEIPETVVPPPVDVLRPVFDEQTVAILQERAAAEHPELQKLAQKTRQLRIEERFRRNELLPALNLNYNMLHQFSNNQYDFSGAYMRNNYKVGVQLSVPLFMRKERGKLQQTILKVQENSLEQLQTNREIVNQIQASFNQVQTWHRLILLQRDMVSNYVRLRDGEIRKLENGESSLFLVNAREAKLIEAQLKLLSLQTKYEQEKAALLWAAGVISQPEWRE